MRLVDADELIKRVDNDTYIWEHRKNHVRCMIQTAPTVDAVPVVHGEWFDASCDEDIKFGQHLYFCSVCNKNADGFVGGTEDWWCSRKPNYCPNCGAKMDGKEQDG